MKPFALFSFSKNLLRLVLPLAFLGLLTACDKTANQQTGALETPVLVSVEKAQGTGWVSVPLDRANIFPKAGVMPPRGNALRVVFTGPLGAYEASAQDLSGQMSPIILPKGRGLALADGSYFEMVSTDPNTSPPTHIMYLKLPIAGLADPINYSLRITQKSLTTNRTDSAPLIIELARQPLYTVAVRIVGDGRVNSTPAGISCGSSAVGSPLTTCSFDFGSEMIVQLTPGSGPNGRFRGWSGDCNPNDQVCALRLDGNPKSAIANFGAASTPSGTCPMPSLIAGWNFVGTPNCGTALNPLAATIACDNNGYFCCSPETGASAPRCGGADKKETRPTCAGVGTNSLLIQPSGCYERASP
jgi:hypothetical protein